MHQQIEIKMMKLFISVSLYSIMAEPLNYMKGTRMFNTIKALLIGLMLMFSYSANADFFSSNDCPPWAYDCNDWPEWTPMYWMEEMSNEFDDNNDYYGGPYGAPMPYGGPGPYGGPAPYGAPMPYGGPAPYGAPMMPPQGAPMMPPQGAPMPYGRPMPYGMPPQGAPFGGPVPPYGRPAPQNAPAN